MTIDDLRGHHAGHDPGDSCTRQMEGSWLEKVLGEDKGCVS